MPKLLLLLSFVLLSASLSQGQNRVKEAGISLRNFETFGVLYKVGRADALWRFNSLYISADKADDGNLDYNTSKRRSFGIGFLAGREFRKSLSEKLQFRYGFDLSFDYSFSKEEVIFLSPWSPSNNYTSTVKRFGPGLNGVIGLNFIISDRILLGAEILPGFFYQTGKRSVLYDAEDKEDVHTDISSIGFSASISSAMLTLSYQFVK